LPWVSSGSDAESSAPEGVFLRSLTRPRAYGNFARIFSKYVREEHVVSVEEAVRKITSLPADVLSHRDRGRLVRGTCADIVVFDPATFQEHATYGKPMQYATGVTGRSRNGGAREPRSITSHPLSHARRARILEPLRNPSSLSLPRRPSLHRQRRGTGISREVSTAESDTGMFGGNSNWRGPIWMPVNVILIRALMSFYLYYGDNFKIECPTGSGHQMNLFEVAREIACICRR
jgi:hypothetical protein